VSHSTMPNVAVRPVTMDDLPAWWEMRLRALRDHPEAFGQSYEDARIQAFDDIVREFRERWTANDNRLLLACNDAEIPLGTLGIFRQSGSRFAHRMNVWGVYTLPEWRGQGISRALLAEAIAYARSLPGVLQIHLTVTTTNVAAKRFYERAGFIRYGREPRALLLPDGPIDEDLMVLMLDNDSGPQR